MLRIGDKVRLWNSKFVGIIIEIAGDSCLVRWQNDSSDWYPMGLLRKVDKW